MGSSIAAGSGRKKAALNSHHYITSAPIICAKRHARREVLRHHEQRRSKREMWRIWHICAPAHNQNVTPVTVSVSPSGSRSTIALI
jgi:hypothetical protein